MIVRTLVALLVMVGAASAAPLDITAYLQLAGPDVVYPTAEQIEMLRPYMPKKRIQPAPPIGDRAFWTRIAASASGKAVLAEAEAFSDMEPEVPISDERYRKAQLTGDRTMYKPRYYDTMKRLEHFMLAECMENQGRFLPRIETYLRAIVAMKSWVHPNHDKGWRVLDGEFVKVDLGARLFGTDLAIAELLLGDRLSADLRAEIPKQLRRRVIDTYLSSCRGDDTYNKWMKGTSNWNSVCTSGCLFVILAAGTGEERVLAMGCALNSMKSYLSGFGADGYCSEGIGYWGYGFGHYQYLAQIVHDYTGGTINLFAYDNPEKLKNVAHFPSGFHIQQGVFPAFSDNNIKNPSDFGNFSKAIAATYYGLDWPFNEVHPHGHEQLVQWASLKGCEVAEIPASPPHSFFEEQGIVVSRGFQEAPLSIAFKGGHNAENHNHSDVGSYTLVLGDTLIAGDIGKPMYIAGAFSPDNKSRSSWGHPVPRVHGQLQANGRERRGKIMKTSFTEKEDVVVMDVATAYDVEGLKSLLRTMKNDRSGLGTISITDRFAAEPPIDFGTTIMTYAEIEVVDENNMILKRDGRQVRVSIQAEGGALEFSQEMVPVQLMSFEDATRIGVSFKKPLSKGSITVRFEPISQGK